MKVCLGGTFSTFHAGHEALLHRACRDATELFVGVTDGPLAKRNRSMPSWAERAEMVEFKIREMGYEGNLQISPLTEPMGPAAREDYDALVVSPETVTGALAIQEARDHHGLAPLKVIVVPHVLAQDLLPISASRIASGDIDRDGKCRQPVRIAVGSANPIKVAAIERKMAKLIGYFVEVKGFDVSSGVPEQPTGPETMQGALQRADKAMEAWPEATYAIGLEAGLQDLDGWFDMQACAVQDARGHTTTGWGPGFSYPGWINKRALAGEMISDILGPVANDMRIGGTTGAIGFLSDGSMDRLELSQIALLMAMVPRFKPYLWSRE